jgi:hypothetical protein
VLLRRHRQELEDGTIIDIVLWRLHETRATLRTPLQVPSDLRTRGNTVRLGYDNERGKGDHCHIGGREEPSRFKSPVQLIDDFLAHIERSRK